MSKARISTVRTISMAYIIHVVQVQGAPAKSVQEELDEML